MVRHSVTNKKYRPKIKPEIVDLCSSSSESESNAPPSLDAFVKLKDVPSSCSDPEGECLDHTAAVIANKIAVNEQRTIQNLSGSNSYFDCCFYIFILSIASQMWNRNLKKRIVASVVMAGLAEALRKPDVTNENHRQNHDIMLLQLDIGLASIAMLTMPKNKFKATLVLA